MRSLEKAQEGNNQAPEKQQLKLDALVPPLTSSTSSAIKLSAVSPSGEKIDFQLQVRPATLEIENLKTCHAGVKMNWSCLNL